MAGRRGAAKAQVQMQVQEPMEVSRKRPWEKVDADASKNMLVLKEVQDDTCTSFLLEHLPSYKFSLQAK